VEIPDDMDAFTDMLWNSLNEDNKVSLFVRFIDIETGAEIGTEPLQEGDYQIAAAVD
jgi:hypothetical protein